MRALFGVQTSFSFHWGTASPAAWFERAAELGYAYVGIADNAALHGLPEIVGLAAKSRVRPLYGATFRFGRNRTVAAYAGTALGYANLCQKITRWHRLCDRSPYGRAGGIPALSAEAAAEFFAEPALVEGLAFITDDAGAWQALRGNGAEIYWRIGPALTAPPSGIDRESWLFAPGPVLLHADEYETHRLLRAVGGAAALDRVPTGESYGRADAPFLMEGPDCRLYSPEEYGRRFSVYGEALERADRLAERLAGFRPCQDVLSPPTPADAGQAAGWGESAMARLRRLAYEGAAIRYGEISERARKRLEYELDLIGGKGFAEYFLVVHDIVARLAGGDGRLRRGRSVTCGRGSGAASLVNYCLGVTNVDVLKHNLMFERFLNQGRADPPDIDVDFAWDERDDVLDRVFGEFGGDHVARVANHNRYDWRGAFRAAARTLGYTDAEISRHLRESPGVYAEPHPGGTPTTDRTAKKMAVLGRPGRSEWNRVAALARRLVDLPYGLSMHCGGVVIAPGNLSRIVPTVISGKGQPTIQWEKDGAEEMGLVKIDLLGNRSLAVIRDAVRAVAEAEGIPGDEVIRGDPTDDPSTRDLVSRGDTFGVFYFESPSMRLLMAKAGKGDFAHAVIHSSIIRPAANAFINEYVARVRGKVWEYEDQALRNLFDESYGIPVYQEDVIRLAMALTGCDYAEADSLRKCLGKRDARERLAAAYPALAEAAARHGTKEPALAVFRRTLMSMTGYSFCKPHSASYAQVSYEAAYLRAHHPAYFIAAVLSNGGGYYSVQAYVSEAMRLGLAVRGPDVNVSGVKWSAEGKDAIRTGLAAVSGLSETAIRAILDARGKGGRFAGLEDFLRRVRLATDDMRQLALAGALDSLAPELNRPQLMWLSARERGGAGGGASSSGGLFARHVGGGAGEMLAYSGRMVAPDLPPYTVRQRHAAEYAALGFIPGFHPMVLFEEEIRDSLREFSPGEVARLVEAADLGTRVDQAVTILAWPVSAKIVETRDGESMMFQSFEDCRALFEAVIFPREFDKYHRLLTTMQPLWVTGRVESEFGVSTLRVTRIRTVCRRSVSAIPHGGGLY